MGKRKCSNKIALWQTATGFYVAGLEQQRDLQTWRQSKPNIKVIFLRIWTLISAAMELATTRSFHSTADYYIIDGQNTHDLGVGDAIHVRGHKLIWDGTTFTYLGSRMCETCFKAGTLYPEMCPRHVTCNHSKKERDKRCAGCVSQSLAGCWKDKIQCFDKQRNNNRHPFDVTYGQIERCWFTCNVCSHAFQLRPNHIIGNWCSYCSNRTRCNDVQCTMCRSHSLEACDKHVYLHPTLNHGITARQIALHTNRVYWFSCGTCTHDFEISPNNISHGAWCSYCSNHKRCDKPACTMCLNHSLEASDKYVFLHPILNDGKTARQIAISDGRLYWFTCGDCRHDFEISPRHIAEGQWCTYCANMRRCDEVDCLMCRSHSLEASAKAAYLHPTRNGNITARQIALNDHRLYWFNCDQCPHEFEISPANITQGGHWCPYCPNQKRCEAPNCNMCRNHSFESSDKIAFWHPTRNGTVTPRQLALNDALQKCWFTCAICSHEFDMTPAHVQVGQWCPFCAGQRRCDQPQCTVCAKSCEVCLSRKATHVSQVSRRACCKPCLTDNIARDPAETPRCERAKISLEIYTIAALQSQNWIGSFLAQEPTTWDCAVLPGLGFKPDVLWCFNMNDQVIATSSSEKLTMNQIAYALQLEIVEHSRQVHSDLREIPDDEREAQIRHLFGFHSIPVGFVYVTMAHNRHMTAHKDDVFFSKSQLSGEYAVMNHREAAWQTRITELQTTLIDLRARKSNETIYIGH